MIRSGLTYCPKGLTIYKGKGYRNGYIAVAKSKGRTGARGRSQFMALHEISQRMIIDDWLTKGYSNH